MVTGTFINITHSVCSMKEDVIRRQLLYRKIPPKTKIPPRGGILYFHDLEVTRSN